ncbi:hypothetical protein F5Y14DRAFT_399318 [Nemania sp. NC0429]|nr:hypothetical protein F5Y14DRAFT_399318 [Nemania sp. NC0429]
MSETSGMPSHIGIANHSQATANGTQVLGDLPALPDPTITTEQNRFYEATNTVDNLNHYTAQYFDQSVVLSLPESMTDSHTPYLYRDGLKCLEVAIRGSLKSFEDEFRGMIKSFGDEIRGEIGSLRDEIRSLRDEIGSLRDETRSLRDEIGSLRDVTRSLRDAFRPRKDKIESSKNGLTNAPDTLKDDLTNEHTTSRGHLVNEMDTVKDDLTDEIDTVRDGLAEEIDTLEGNRQMNITASAVISIVLHVEQVQGTEAPWWVEW